VIPIQNLVLFVLGLYVPQQCTPPQVPRCLSIITDNPGGLAELHSMLQSLSYEDHWEIYSEVQWMLVDWEPLPPNEHHRFKGPWWSDRSWRQRDVEPGKVELNDVAKEVAALFLVSLEISTIARHADKARVHGQQGPNRRSTHSTMGRC
jgi:hypothetical protein